MLFAKLVLGAFSSVAIAGVYTFHQGVIQVDVDEFEHGGSHVHVWVPAAIVPTAVRFVPKDQMCHAGEQLKPMLPAIKKLAKELEKYPNVDFVDVLAGTDHVQIRTRGGKLQIDVHESGQAVHIACPLSTLEDLFSELETSIPAA